MFYKAKMHALLIEKKLLGKEICFAGHSHSLGTVFGGRQKITCSHKPLYENNRGVSLRVAAGSISYYEG